MKRQKVNLFMLCMTLIIALCPILGRAETGDNLLVNADFSQGMGNWWLGQQDGGVASAATANGAVSVNIQNPGRWPWSVQLGQSGLKFEKNWVYEVSFEARSTEIRQLQVMVAMKDAPYYNYSGNHAFRLESEFRRYAFTFTMRQTTDGNANLQFPLGRFTRGTVEIAHPRIVRIGPKSEDVIPKDFPKPFADRMMRGIIFGNTLDAPQEGAWGPELREEYFDIIKESGRFDHIRIPVSWSSHAQNKAPYTVDPEFMRRVDWAVSQALHRGFYVVLNFHHYDALNTNPPANKEEFIAIWRQIAEYFKDYPDNLYFEILNEPHQAMDGYWNQYYPQVYDAIRQTNPTRTVIISCPGWANVTQIDQLTLPKRIKADPNIMVQFHFYYPNNFCAQGSIGNGADDVSGVRWTGSEGQKRELTALVNHVAAWAKRNGDVRLWNGEFCAHAGRSVEEDRRLWTAYVIKLCEERGIAWAYWDFANDTARVYDADMKRWNDILPE